MVQLPMFRSQTCIQPVSSCKMCPSLCLYPRWQHWELLSSDQFPAALRTCQHANVLSHFPGPGRELQVPGWGQQSVATGSSAVAAPLLWAQVLAGQEGTGSMADFLVKDNKSREWGPHTSLFARIMISTTINPFFQPTPVEQPEWTLSNSQQPEHCVGLSWLV